MKSYLSTAVAGLFLLTAVLLPTKAIAQIHEVEQTVFGMDCAPCAHGLQKRLGKIDGVHDVKVSLKQGVAILELDAENMARLGTVREGVKESGFAAKQATVRVSGILKKEDGDVVLISPAGERFVLKQSKEASAEYGRLKSAAAGKQVTLTGIVPEGETEDRWTLQVLRAQV